MIGAAASRAAALGTATAELRAAGIDAPRRDARLLMQHALGLSPEALLAGDRLPLAEDEGRRLTALVRRRAAREPIAYLTGGREFWSLDFAVDRSALVPRPESETLVEAVLAHYPSIPNHGDPSSPHLPLSPSPLRAEGERGGTTHSPSPPPSQASGASARRLRDTKRWEERAGVRRGRPGLHGTRPRVRAMMGYDSIRSERALTRAPRLPARLRLLDLGTGTGCLLVTLLKELPGAVGLGIDVSAAAVSLARANARRHGLGERAFFAVADWGAPLAVRFDIVVSNPPYVAAPALASLAPEIARHEPRTALAGGVDGYECYRRLAPQIARLLAPGGLAAVELGAGMADEVESLFAAAGLVEIGRRCDLSGIERCAMFARDTDAGF